MNKLQYKFSGKTTTWYLDTDFSYLGKLVDQEQTVLITDEHVFGRHQQKFGEAVEIGLIHGAQFLEL